MFGVGFFWWFFNIDLILYLIVVIEKCDFWDKIYLFVEEVYFFVFKYNLVDYFYMWDKVIFSCENFVFILFEFIFLVEK